MILIWPIYLIFVIIFIYLYKYKNAILYSAIIGASFSATSAINININEGLGSGVSFSWAMIIIYIISEILVFIFKYSRRFNTITVLPIHKYIISYWFLVLIGLINLGFGDFNYLKIDRNFLLKSPGLDLSNISAFLYLTIGILFILIFSTKASKEQVKEVMILYVWGVSLACFLALFDQYISGNFFSTIFNTSISKYAQGFTDHEKLSGPAVESSIFIQCVGVALSILVAKILSKKGGGGGWSAIDYILFLLMSITIFLSGSHSSMLVLIGLALEILFLERNFVKKMTIIFILLVSAIPFFITLSEKMDTYSGVERYDSIIGSANLIFENPLLGYGFAEVTSHDLIINSLVNCGLIATFILMLIFLKLLKLSHKSKYVIEDRFIMNASFGGLLIILVTNLFTGFSYPFVHFYIVIAIATWIYLHFDARNNIFIKI